MSLTYADFSRNFNAHLRADKSAEWAGIPLPMPGASLQVEPKHPFRDRILAANAVVNPPQVTVENDPTWRVINKWYSHRDHCDVYIVEADGKRRAIRQGHRNGRRISYLLRTMDVSQMWDLDAELTAIEALERLIRPHLFEAYAKMGAFLETSKRSGLTYVFRRLAPTLVLTPHRRSDDDEAGEMLVLCALCLHPIAFYQGTHAGAMVPTDDVIAHLLMMRADEHLFWRRSNQHDPRSPEVNFMI